MADELLELQDQQEMGELEELAGNMHEHLDVMMQHLNQEQEVINESFRSQLSKPSQMQQS